MKKAILLSALLAGSALALGATPAAAWETLGSRQVNLGNDHDTIQVEGHARYARIKLCVANKAVRFHDLDVNFRNGGHQDVAIRALIPVGGCTRNIDLEGGRRDIRNIQLRYETAGINVQHAYVTVYGE